jgi:hypothetical protein
MKTPPPPPPAADPMDDASVEHALRASRRLEDAPEHVIQRAFAAWQPRRAAAPAAPSLLQRVVAALTFDSAGASPLAFGMRSAGGTTRQLLFSAEGHDIDLRISPDADPPSGHWLLSGQVLGPDSQGHVTLTDTLGQEAAQSALNEWGEFKLPQVAGGEYTVTVRLGEREIVLPAVLVRHAV